MIEIWGRPTSICTQRVLWACVEARLDFKMHLASATMGPNGHVSTGAEPFGVIGTQAYRAMNPNDTIPSIRDNDFVLWESNAIVTYVALKYAATELYADDVETFAVASQWMAWTNERLEPGLHMLVMQLHRLQVAERSAAAAEAAAEEVARWARLLEQHLSVQPYVAGQSFSMGDIPVAAAAHRWKLFAIERPATPHIDAWLERLASREGFRRHVQPSELHLA